MRIKNNFLIFKTLKNYQKAETEGKIKDDSIVFVIENRGIYTHGIKFGAESHNKGLIGSVDKLPNGEPGDSAIVQESGTWYLYYYDSTNGWTRGDECDIPSMSQDTLDQYLKKVNIREYLHHEYDNTYVRRDEVYSPDQEEWVHPDDSGEDEWQWDENGNLYRIDAELSTVSRNAVQNKVITNALSQKKDPLVYDSYDRFVEDKDAGRIANDVIVYIKDKGLIYAYGTFFSGGGGSGEGGVPVKIYPPILYKTSQTQISQFPTNYNAYTQVSELNSSKNLTVSLNNKYLLLLIPTMYQVTNIVTSNNERLTLQDDFIYDSSFTQIASDSGVMIHVKAYKYFPVIAPNMSLTFTFNV